VPLGHDPVRRYKVVIRDALLALKVLQFTLICIRSNQRFG
jgi:hypothetical protein